MSFNKTMLCTALNSRIHLKERPLWI